MAAELLSVKMVAEGFGPEVAVVAGGVPVGRVDRALFRAVEEGIILVPSSRITRKFPGTGGGVGEPSTPLAAIL